MLNLATNYEKELSQNYPQAVEYINDIDQQLAERAFYNTSFSPEKRGVSVRFEYADSLIIDKASIIEVIEKAVRRGAEVDPDYKNLINSWFESHRERVCKLYHEWLYSHSSVASSFITGPANFPVARNAKRARWADNKLAAIDEFRTKSKKRIEKRVLPYGDGFNIKSNDPSANDKIRKKIESLESLREQMKEINKLVRKYFKNGNPEIHDDKLNEFKEIMQVKFNFNDGDIVGLLKPAYNGKIIGYFPWQLQNLGANINRYKKRLKAMERTKEVTLDQEFSNGISVYISDDNKICINFGFKPDEETRKLLKSQAFKFSRNRDNAWVRMVTPNAIGSYNYYIKPIIEKLEVC